MAKQEQRTAGREADLVSEEHQPPEHQHLRNSRLPGRRGCCEDQIPSIQDAWLLQSLSLHGACELISQGRRARQCESAHDHISGALSKICLN